MGRTSGKQLKLDATLQSGNVSIFKSLIITGTGSSQSTPHGLGRIPAKVFIHIVGSPSTYVALTITEGTHTTSNILITCTTGWKYVIEAW